MFGKDIGMRFFLVLLIASLLMCWGKKSGKTKNLDPDELSKQAFQASSEGKQAEAMKLFEKVLKVQPNNANALVQLGMYEMGKPDRDAVAFDRLERAFSADAIPMPVPQHSVQGQWLACIIGRRRFEMQDFKRARWFFEKAATSQANAAVCPRIQYATSLLASFPESDKDAVSKIKLYMKKMDEILEMVKGKFELGPHDNDPYIFCLLTAFYQTAYYRAEHRITMGKHAQVALGAFPWLTYTAPHLANPTEAGSCHRRLKIGIVSGMMYRGTPPMADFGNVMGRLSRDDFDMTFIYLKEDKSPPSIGILEERGHNATPPYGYDNIVREEDRGMTIEKREGWLERAREQVGALELDLLLYLDTTMSAMTNQLAMSRLARVQAASHGHPTTSGIPKSILNYYISWAAAELPTAQDHYSEELALLPAETMHQWYESRVTPDGASTENGQKFMHLTREDFAVDGLLADGHWYMCMQKPFKRMPEFDRMLAAVHAADPTARLILHDTETDETKETVEKRLRSAGVKIDRVHFLSAVPHHRLLALYRLTDVILDSYPMGGCTTTREALEVGGLVVTLPAKYLGSRWSLAYYSILGVMDLVAEDDKDYVDIAVRMASNQEVRRDVQERIKERLGRLFQRPEAVEEWTRLLKRLARGTDAACSA